MVNHYKPQFDHQPFNWGPEQDELQRQLLRLRVKILIATSIFLEHGVNAKGLKLYPLLRDRKKSPLLKGRKDVLKLVLEAKAYFEELIGIVSETAAIAIDGGYRAASQVISTIRAVEKSPELLIDKAKTIESEALGAICSHFHLGTKCAFPILDRTMRFKRNNPKILSARLRDAICKACHEAILTLELQKKRGRRVEIAQDKLAAELRSWLNRYGDGLRRHAYADQSPAYTAVELILGPLNDVLERHGIHKFDPKTVTRRVLDATSTHLNARCEVEPGDQ